MNKTKHYLKIVISGHVDHGKSTLIGRLFYDTDSIPEEKIKEIKEVCRQLGREMEFSFVMDNLQEEREQSITIDTAQTFFKTPKREYVIIDAPGHKEFIKNMITGASQAEAGVLIVSAKEGAEEQTKRHAYILKMLDLKQILVVINKMDLVDYKRQKFNKVKKQIEAFLKKLNLKPTFIIPISAAKGDNIAKKSKKMKWHKGKTLLSSLDSFKESKKITKAPLRFLVQDIYPINQKRILVGRVESGTIKKGQKVLILPSKETAKIKSIEVFMKKPTSASAGQSIGITLEEDLFIERGAVICTQKDQPKVTDEISANVFWMSKKDLKRGERIIIKNVTQETEGEIKTISNKIDSSTFKKISAQARILKNNEVGEVKIKIDEPIAIDDPNQIKETGRIILERDMIACGAGLINIEEK